MMFLMMADGNHTTEEDIEIIKTSFLRLEPGESKWGGRGHLQCSGQEMEMPEKGRGVEITVEKGKVRVMV